MYPLWRKIYNSFLRFLRTAAAIAGFGRLKRGYPILRGWRAPVELAEHLTVVPARLVEENGVLADLVRAAQGRGSGRPVATAILWAAFVPSLDRAHAALWSEVGGDGDDLLALMAERFTARIQLLDVRPRTQIAASLLFGVGVWREEAFTDLQGVGVGCDEPHTTAYLARVGPSITPAPDSLARLHELLRANLGVQDADVLLAVAAFDETRAEVARAWGRSKQSIGQRYLRALRRARRVLSRPGRPRLSPSAAPGPSPVPEPSVTASRVMTSALDEPALLGAAEALEHAPRATVDEGPIPGPESTEGPLPVSVERDGPLHDDPSDPAEEPDDDSLPTEHSVEVSLSLGDGSSVERFPARYCDVCQRWGAPRSTHLCGVNWYPTLRALRRASGPSLALGGTR